MQLVGEGDAQIHLYPDSRVCISSRVDEDLAGQLTPRERVYAEMAPSSPIIAALRARGLREDDPRGESNTRVTTSESGSRRPFCAGLRDIRVEYHHSLNSAGRPYMVTIRVQQGSSLWVDRIERPHIIRVLGGTPVNANDGSYWDFTIDKTKLMRSAVEHIDWEAKS